MDTRRLLRAVVRATLQPCMHSMSAQRVISTPFLLGVAGLQRFWGEVGTPFLLRQIRLQWEGVHLPPDLTATVQPLDFSTVRSMEA